MRFLLANPRRVLLKRLLALALVLSPVPGSALSLAAPAGSAHCGERVCQCAHHCPTRKPAQGARKAAPCHQEAPLASTYWQQGPCGASRPNAEAPPPVRPHLAEAAFEVVRAVPSAAVPAAEHTEPAAGFVRLVLQPPRANA